MTLMVRDGMPISTSGRLVDVGHFRRECEREDRSRPQVGLDAQLSTQRPGAFLHADDPEPAATVVGLPVVGDAHQEIAETADTDGRVLVGGEFDSHRGHPLGMPLRVVPVTTVPMGGGFLRR